MKNLDRNASPNPKIKPKALNNNIPDDIINTVCIICIENP